MLLILIFTAAVFCAIFWYRIAYRETYKGTFSRVTAPLLIFDFDGTICPSYGLFIEQVNILAAEHHFKKIEQHEIESIREMRPLDIMKKLGVSKFKLPFLLVKARRNIQKQLLDLKPVPGIADLLIKLKTSGYSLGILTSNSAENVSLYLEKHQIDFFDFIYAGNNIFGKEGHLKKILRKSGLQPEQLSYIGDETRDIEAAHRVQLKSIAVTWGYNSSKLLQESKPSILVDVPSQLISD